MDEEKIFCTSCKALKLIQKGKTCERCRERKRRYRDKLPKKRTQENGIDVEPGAIVEKNGGASAVATVAAAAAATTAMCSMANCTTPWMAIADVPHVKNEDFGSLMINHDSGMMNNSNDGGGRSGEGSIPDGLSLHQKNENKDGTNLLREMEDVNKYVLQIVESALNLLGGDCYQKRTETLKRVKMLVLRKENEGEVLTQGKERKRRKRKLV